MINDAVKESYIVNFDFDSYMTDRYSNDIAEESFGSNVKYIVNKIKIFINKIITEIKKFFLNRHISKTIYVSKSMKETILSIGNINELAKLFFEKTKAMSDQEFEKFASTAAAIVQTSETSIEEDLKDTDKRDIALKLEPIIGETKAIYDLLLDTKRELNEAIKTDSEELANKYSQVVWLCGKAINLNLKVIRCGFSEPSNMND